MKCTTELARLNLLACLMIACEIKILRNEQVWSIVSFWLMISKLVAGCANFVGALTVYDRISRQNVSHARGV
jgi:hypothetical protein